MNTNSLSRINGKTVYLRKFSLDDAHKLYQMSQEDGMKTWIPDQVYENESEAKDVLTYLIGQYTSEKGPAESPIVLGVCRKDTAALIGHAGLSPVKNGVEIGYAIAENEQKKGFATDAIVTLCDWALAYYSLSSILGIVSVENTASCKTLEKAGFDFIEQKEQLLHGKRATVKIYEK